ncbi:MAG: T9SS type A sorting domain-containing protein [Ignavibacteria bacterium]
MKRKFLYLCIVSFIFYSDISFSQKHEGRFRKSLDEETNEKGLIENSFTEHRPLYNSSVFVNYNITRDSSPQNETSVKISRKDPTRVVAAWRDFRRRVSPANRKVGYSYSSDGGVSWSEGILLDSTLLPGFPRNSDPVVGTDTAGNFYIAVISIGGTGALAVYKSTDGGVTFPSAYLIANSGSEDKEYMETDFNPASPYCNTIYMSWTRFSTGSGIKITRSSNAGVNWTAPVNVSDNSSGGQGSDVAVGPDGEVYVSWLDGNSSNDIVKLDRSTNGGQTFSTDIDVTAGSTPFIPISSSGVTFPSIGADVSNGPRRGNVYITFCDARNGDADIFLTRSTDKGLSWSPPVRVNDDAVGNNKLQCWPWIGVNDSGFISIIYFDSRNTASNEIIEAYMAHSTDGGLTFTNYKLSSQPTTTNQPNNDVRFGDYIGIDYYKNRIVPVWTDERSGGFNMECYTAIVSTPVSVTNISGIIPEKYLLKQNFPNPFNPTTKIRYELPLSSAVTIKVYDVLGNEIRSFTNLQQNAGIYEFEFEGSSLSSGIYFYRLSTEKFSETKSMMLIK